MLLNCHLKRDVKEYLIITASALVAYTHCRKGLWQIQSYSDIIEDYKAQSIVEEVTDVGPPSKTHYLPHQAVLREEHDTTKTRVVFNASSKLKDPSLNEQLHQGPCLLPLLFDILCRF